MSMREKIADVMFTPRWHAANLLFRVGLGIAPAGSSRNLLERRLKDFNEEIFAAVRADKEGK